MADFYVNVYTHLYDFAHYKVNGVLLCRLIAPVILVAMLWISRIVSSVPLKLFSVIIAIMFYFLPSVVGVFLDK